jgi:hypothetical protein
MLHGRVEIQKQDYRKEGWERQRKVRLSENLTGNSGGTAISDSCLLMGVPIFYSCQGGSKNYWLKDFRYLKPKRASVTKIYAFIGLEYV